MIRFEYCVTTKASRKQTWEIFSNWRRWNEFANIYGEHSWREGRPWEAGSRLEIRVLRPVKTIVDHVIRSCQPARKVHTWGDIVHSGVTIAGRTAEQLVASFTETWYENFRTACNQFAEASGD
jgi:hypothetical protein